MSYRVFLAYRDPWWRMIMTRLTVREGWGLEEKNGGEGEDHEDLREQRYLFLPPECGQDL